ncbi:hypothetical protein [Wenyingzhuangia sp. IMCC45574]
MKTLNIKHRITSTMLLLLAALTFVGCDLELQETWEFDSEVAPQVTFGETSLWEWLETNPGGEYNFMIEAIQRTGLVDLYNDKTVNYTFFIMKDGAFTNNGNGVFSRQFGFRNTASLDPVDVFDDARVDVDIMREILKHLILDQYVDQGPDNLKTLDVHYVFNTLTDDPNNKTMTISRDWQYRMVLNTSPDLITGGNGRINAVTSLHNYIFSNGNSVAHVLPTNKMTRKYKFGLEDIGL